MGDLLRATPDATERRSLLDRWYWPHHLKLERMVNTFVAAVKREGLSVTVDAPFAGALVPLSCYRKDDRILSVMIEDVSTWMSIPA
jgi:hypothetical protein